MSLPRTDALTPHLQSVSVRQQTGDKRVERAAVSAAGAHDEGAQPARGAQDPRFSSRGNRAQRQPRIFPRALLSPLPAGTMSLTVPSPAGTRSQRDGVGASERGLRGRPGRAGLGEGPAWHTPGYLATRAPREMQTISRRAHATRNRRRVSYPDNVTGGNYRKISFEGKTLRTNPERACRVQRLYCND